ncbi:MAG: aminodeoxychorismate/anthranilate synthase component II [Candidatus Methanomethylophilaceae archaeon]|nr:aminodeoxychorismate/anthranilate synthase component II [Candidatus Methanomethylophilaceae archaeon]MDD3378961.1 aminodeoxychorismate/anthranilate synthase component II [Candidatus Methanomethylophilaceae archaeon]MDY0224220.1 aminodeoxychorismate/anthranilate synthase component II [Candidatus Methanomethylophilaceae archaeon]
MILLIDNYDSFSYNLYQLIGSIDPDIKIVRNDKITLDEIEKMNPAAIVLSPGPGRPENAGICIDVIRRFGKSIPILGVCLGHQAICEAYGATVSYAKTQMHGKQSIVRLYTESPIFRECPESVPVARYHSLAVVQETLPSCLRTIAKSDDGEVMAVCHRSYDVYGVQFHPESIMTPNGEQMMRNFLKMIKRGYHD